MTKRLRRHRTFEKSFEKRISPNSKLVHQFERRLSQWIAGMREAPIFDHPLSGKLAGRRAFSVNGDIRVVYAETEDTVIFIDIGTHAQVYGE